jgi:hypothetical protein
VGYGTFGVRSLNGVAQAANLSGAAAQPGPAEVRFAGLRSRSAPWAVEDKWALIPIGVDAAALGLTEIARIDIEPRMVQL